LCLVHSVVQSDRGAASYSPGDVKNSRQQVRVSD